MNARLPNEFYHYLAELLPPQPTSGPQGGRPPIDHDTVLKVIWFVLTAGCRWKGVPKEMGCCGQTARTRLRDWQRAGLWKNLHHMLLTELRRQDRLKLDEAVIDSVQVRAFSGGDRSGPSPVDRRKPGTKYTVKVDLDGRPLAMQAAGANVSDHRQILSTAVMFPQIGGKPGRPRMGPGILYADAGYDSDTTRGLLECLGISPKIRCRKNPHGSHLGRVRWVVERTIGWITDLRRIRVRYDRESSVIDAWMNLALSAVTFRILQQSG